MALKIYTKCVAYVSHLPVTFFINISITVLSRNKRDILPKHLNYIHHILVSVVC